jgi:hypothetical protein
MGAKRWDKTTKTGRKIRGRRISGRRVGDFSDPIFLPMPRRGIGSKPGWPTEDTEYAETGRAEGVPPPKPDYHEIHERHEKDGDSLSSPPALGWGVAGSTWSRTWQGIKPQQAKPPERLWALLHAAAACWILLAPFCGQTALVGDRDQTPGISPQRGTKGRQGEFGYLRSGYSRHEDRGWCWLGESVCSRERVRSAYGRY